MIHATARDPTPAKPERRPLDPRAVARTLDHTAGPSTDELRRRLGNQGTRALFRKLALGSASSDRARVKAPAIAQSNSVDVSRYTISRPGDTHEQEADRVADAVMRMPAHGPHPAGVAASVSGSAPATVQRLCAECEDELSRTKGGADQAMIATGSKIRRKQAQASATASTPTVSADSIAQRGGGSPLPAATRAFFEPRFGVDFGEVRVHTGARAAEAAKAIDARAYTLGNDLVFGTGQYAPDSGEGKRLLAHELTHVIQQSGGRGEQLQRQPATTNQSGAAKGGPADQAVKPLTEDAEPKKAGGKKAKPACTRTIFAEGTCSFLVANSRFICCDPDHGLKRSGKKTDIEGAACADEKFTPIFTCDNTCKTALDKGCDDSDNWMAIPKNQFSRTQCGDVWTICANGKQTTGYVRDQSVTESRFEVSPGIQTALGVTVGSSFKGAIYTGRI